LTFGLGRPALAQAAEEKPKITEVYPPVAYPSKGTTRYDLTIFGENFGESQTNLSIELSGIGALSMEWVANAPQDRTKSYAQLVNARQIHVWNLPQPEHTEDLKLHVIRGQQRSDSFDLKLSRVRRWDPALRAAALTVVGMIILWLLIHKLSKERKWAQVDDEVYGPIRTFLLDRETDTYSLSRFQLLVWTLTGVYGYMYLLFARWLVQGRFELVDVPKNFPALLLVSGGTAALAQGVTSLRGPKGSGDVQPGWQDYISVGGQIAAERVQFFIWTLLGASAFLLMLVVRDPGGVKELPTIPEQFAYLIGFSSAAYLGGKLARKPGPVIDEIRTEMAGSNLVLTIRGSNLHKDASFRMDNVDVNQANFPDNFKYTVEPGDKDLRGDSSESYRSLKLSFDKPKREWTNHKTVLTLVNRDGQKAEWPLPAPFKIVMKSIPADTTKRAALLAAIDKLNPDARRQIEQAGAAVKNVVVLKDVPKEEAEKGATQLGDCGAVVSVEPMN